MGDNRAGNKEKLRRQRSPTGGKEELRIAGHLKDLILFLCSLTSTQPLTGLGTALPESSHHTCTPFSAFRLFKYTENGGSRFLSTTSILLTDYTASHPTKQ
jgi:hypothetical protein